ncbi:hypothetical protein CoNPh10_CDS0150 [Staphylococcus phage S-CoN_Ph10]|nr:hypothetical protein CoNPh10_CDS0150 [Staphylococcus phage S-CoN_Ph10]
MGVIVTSHKNSCFNLENLGVLFSTYRLNVITIRLSSMVSL